MGRWRRSPRGRPRRRRRPTGGPAPGRSTPGRPCAPCRIQRSQISGPSPIVRAVQARKRPVRSKVCRRFRASSAHRTSRTAALVGASHRRSLSIALSVMAPASSDTVRSFRGNVPGHPVHQRADALPVGSNMVQRSGFRQPGRRANSVDRHDLLATQQIQPRVIEVEALGARLQGGAFEVEACPTSPATMRSSSTPDPRPRWPARYDSVWAGEWVRKPPPTASPSPLSWT